MPRYAFFLALTLGALIAVGAAAAEGRKPGGAARCVAITPQQVAALFDRWNASLGTGNPDAVTQNYAADAVLLPTAANGPLVGRPAIRGYFVHFLEKHPQGKIDQRHVHVGCDLAYDVGTYTFTLDGDQPGSRIRLPARYTYIYAPRAGRWLIVHHHSSAMPEPAH